MTRRKIGLPLETPPLRMMRGFDRERGQLGPNADVINRVKDIWKRERLDVLINLFLLLAVSQWLVLKVELSDCRLEERRPQPSSLLAQISRSSSDKINSLGLPEGGQQQQQQHHHQPRQDSLTRLRRSFRNGSPAAEGDEAAAEATAPRQLHIQQAIPAANPNFEAAFQGECGKNNNSNPCEHICIDLHDGTYECSCFYGFTLAVDGYSCATLPASTRRPTTVTTPPTVEMEEATAAVATTSTTTTTGATEAATPRVLPLPVASSASLERAEEESTANDNRKLVDERLRLRLAAAAKTANERADASLLGRERQPGNEGATGRQRSLLAAAGRKRAAVKSSGRQVAPIFGKSVGQVGGELPPAPSRPAPLQSNSPPITGGGTATATTPPPTTATNASPPLISRSRTPNSAQSEKGNQLKDLDEENRLRADHWEERQRHLSFAAGDKWMSYEVAPQRLQRLNQSFELNFADEFDSDPGDDLVDPDIKSIMMSNDRLVGQLEKSLTSSAAEFASVSANSAMLSESERVNRIGGDDQDDRRSLHNFFGLDQLEELIQRTMLDNAVGQWDLLRFEAAEGRDQQQKQRQEVTEGQASSLLSLPDEHLSSSSSSSSNRLRRTDNIANMTSLPSELNTNRLCINETDVPYMDCSELPECESGGECTLEPLELASRTLEEGRGRNWRPQMRARCRCPIGRGGLLCQKPIQRTVPKFLGRSYLALPMITDPWLLDLRLLFKPDGSHNQQGRRAGPMLLLYSKKFALFLDEMGRIEMRYLDIGADSTSTQEVTRVIGSRDVQLGKWNELIMTDSSSSDSQQPEELYDNGGSSSSVENYNKIVLVTPDKISIERGPNSSELFVAGLPANLGLPPKEAAWSRRAKMAPKSMLGAQMASGFRGCIKRLRINKREYNFGSDLNGDTLDGFDIDECCR